MIVNVAGVLLYSPSGEDLLLLKRPNGNWDLPKGCMEDGEEPEMAAIRETFEETGIQADILNGDPHKDTLNGCPIWIDRAISKTKIVKLSHEHVEFQWIKPDNVVAVLYPPLGVIVDKMMGN